MRARGRGWCIWIGMAQLDGEGTAGGGHSERGYSMIEGAPGGHVVGLGWHCWIGMAKMEGAQLDWDGTTDWVGAAGRVCRGRGMARQGFLGWLEEGIVGSGGHSWIGKAKLERAQLDGSRDGWRE